LVGHDLVVAATAFRRTERRSRRGAAGSTAQHLGIQTYCSRDPARSDPKAIGRSRSARSTDASISRSFVTIVEPSTEMIVERDSDLSQSDTDRMHQHATLHGTMIAKARCHTIRRNADQSKRDLNNGDA